MKTNLPSLNYCLQGVLLPVVFACLTNLCHSAEVAKYTFDTLNNGNFVDTVSAGPAPSSDTDAASTAGSLTAFNLWGNRAIIQTDTSVMPNGKKLSLRDVAFNNTALDTSKGFRFTITPSGSLSLSRFSFDCANISSGATKFAIKYKVGSGAFVDLATNETLPYTTSLSDFLTLEVPFSLQNVTQAVTFEIYFWGAGSTYSHRTSLDNFVVSSDEPPVASYGDIDVSKLPPAGWKNVQWQNPGNWTTIPVTAPLGMDASQKVRDILAANPTGNLLIEFGPGSFDFNTLLSIERSNVQIKGAGAASTTFNLKMSGDSSGIDFRSPNTYGTVMSVGNNPALGADNVVLTAAPGTHIQPGNFVQVYYAAPSWWHEGAKVVAGTAPEYYFSQILQVEPVSGIQGNTIKFTDRLGLDYPGTNCKIRRVDMIHNVGISHAKIIKTNPVVTSSKYPNNITFSRVNNGFISDVVSEQCGSSHFTVSESTNVVIERNKISGSAGNNFLGGRGYGIQLQLSTTKARVTDNKLWNLRHHILLQKGANHNVVSYNSLETPENNADWLCLHGYYAHNNLIEGNRMKDSYSDGQWGKDGPRNTWFRNHADAQLGSLDPSDNSVSPGVNLADTDQTVIIGNKLGSFWPAGTGHYGGRNSVYHANWNQMPGTAVLPTSLYINSDYKPSFLGTKPWPVFGPELTNFGTANTLPAADRPK